MKREILNIHKIDQNHLSSISDFLKIVTDFAFAHGSILWELNPKTEHLYIVAYSFPWGTSLSMRPLPLHESVAGAAIKSKAAIYIPNIKEDKQIYRKSTFWQDLGINSIFSIPMVFENGDDGVLNFYSKEVNHFSKRKRSDLIELTSILPGWYQSLQDRATYSLLNKIDIGLKKIEISQIDKVVSKESISCHLESVCKDVAETFQCFETTIILKDQFRSVSDYECIASTWPDQRTKLTYVASESDGLTGWVLKNKKPVYIPDLSLLDDFEQKEIIQRQFPGIKWNAHGDIRAAIRAKIFSEPKKDYPIPPMGFIAAPIYIGDQLFGAIRCCAALKNPYYFGTKELEILKLIATRISDVWNSWIQQILILEDTKTWESIIRTTNQLDSLVLMELEKPVPNITFIFERVLKSLPDLIKDAEILDVRLYDPESNELYFAAFYGSAWDEGSEEEVQKRKAKKFPINNSNFPSAGSNVFNLKISMVIDPIEKGEKFYSETFAQATRMILAPLVIGKNVLGVLDVRSTSDRPFQASARHALELMAGQLAIYHELVKSVLALQGMQIQQIRTYQDFAHQFRTPIYQASIRAKLALKEVGSDETRISHLLQKHLYATSGLCNKANRVAANLRLFSDLSKSEKISTEKVLIKSSFLIKLLIESASDSRVILNPNKNIEIKVNSDSFLRIDALHIEFDIKMLEQAINVLLDNAIKYSHKNTEIKITGSLLGKSEFHISFINVGIPIRENEASLCLIRGWRSDMAKMVTGEGGGIGLWVLDKIMKANGGALKIYPTDADGNTEIKLIFFNKKYRI